MQCGVGIRHADDLYVATFHLAQEAIYVAMHKTGDNHAQWRCGGTGGYNDEESGSK